VCEPRLEVIVRDDILSARAVICAVAWFALPALFQGRPQALEPILAAAEATTASPIVTVNLWLDRPVTDEPFVGLPGRAMQWVFDKHALFGGESSHLSLVSSAAGAIVGRDNQAIVDLALDELRGALPAARDAVVRRAVVVREKRATFSVAPGQPRRPATRTAVPGLFLAGDWIDTGLPATIESAVVSGHRAAAEALEFLRSGSSLTPLE
jgi:predicted NAD/FAD-dependent oxidoreductase